MVGIDNDASSYRVHNRRFEEPGRKSTHGGNGVETVKTVLQNRRGPILHSYGRDWGQGTQFLVSPGCTVVVTEPERGQLSTDPSPRPLIMFEIFQQGLERFRSGDQDLNGVKPLLNLHRVGRTVR